MADRKRQRKVDCYEIEIPEEVLEQILARLPVKSLLRFKCVSKQWFSIITNPYFMELHLSNQRKISDPQIFLMAWQDYPDVLRIRDEMFLCKTTGNINEGQTINNLPQDYYKMSHSCDGIVCLYGHYNIHVLNFATRQLRTLPPGVVCTPKFRDLGYLILEQVWVRQRYQLTIGHDPVTKQYKIVKVFAPVVDRYWEANMCEIFTLDNNTFASWKPVTEVVPYRIDLTAVPVHVNGAVYWFADEVHHANKSEVIVMFDLHMEKFRPISHPSCCSDPAKPRNAMQLGTLRGCLCLAERESHWQLNIWLMTYNNNVVTWEKLYSLSPNCGTIGPRYAFAEHKDGLFSFYTDLRKYVATPFIESLVPVYGRMLQPQPR